MAATWLVPTVLYVFTTGSLGVASKLALRHVRWQDLVLWSGIANVLAGIVLVLIGEAEVQFGAGSAWAALSSAVAITSLFSFFGALSKGSAGTVIPVSSSYPAVTVILAAIVLSESITVAKAAGVALVVGGVVVLTSARFERGSPAAAPAVGEPAAENTAGWLVPTVIFILAVGGLGITSKLALEHLEWPDLILWSGVGYIVVVVGMLAGGYAKVELVTGTGSAIACAGMSIGSLILLYIALSAAGGEASKVVPITAAYPAVTLIFAALLLGERVTASRVAGVVLVIGGVVAVTTG